MQEFEALTQAEGPQLRPSMAGALGMVPSTSTIRPLMEYDSIQTTTSIQQKKLVVGQTAGLYISGNDALARDQLQVGRILLPN